MYDIGDGPPLPILVDDFRRAKGVSSYFLTHLHADHTRGITKNWSNGVIFCSEVTLRLFNHKFKGLGISSTALRALELGVPHALLLSGSTHATVTLLDANHCPGAVMLLLQAHGRCVLHTGDCRWRADMAQLPCLAGSSIHTAFLDCTYAKPHFVFPSREAAAAQIVSIARKHPEHIVYIAVDTLGKEELLVALAQALDEKIFVSLDRFIRMSLCDFNMGLFTTIAEKSRIRAIDRRLLTRQFIMSQQQSMSCIGIVPTGWSLETPATHEQLSESETRESRTLFFYVPYSLHSSYDELSDFVRRLRPKQIVPTSDYDAGGIESCSELCRRALGNDNMVHVVAIEAIIRCQFGVRQALGKVIVSEHSENNLGHKRKGISEIGAIEETPSPQRTPQRQRLLSPDCKTKCKEPSSADKNCLEPAIADPFYPVHFSNLIKCSSSENKSETSSPSTQGCESEHDSFHSDVIDIDDAASEDSDSCFVALENESHESNHSQSQNELEAISSSQNTDSEQMWPFGGRAVFF